MIEEPWVGVETGGEALHLSADTAEAAATVDIVVDTLCGGQHIHDLRQGVDAAGEAGAEDGVGTMLLHKAHGAHGGIDLADAALPEDYLVVSQATRVAAKSIAHLTILNIHGYNDSNFHLTLFYLLCKNTKKKPFLRPTGKYFFSTYVISLKTNHFSKKPSHPMKRWIRVIIITIFAFAAICLVFIQFTQTRRTVSINDNMFNIGVSNAMEEVIKQISDDVLLPDGTPNLNFRYQSLDSLISEHLLTNGIDIQPIVGIYDEGQSTLLYASASGNERQLEDSPYRYDFSPNSTESSNKYYILLSFPAAQLFLQRNSDLLAYASLILIAIIIIMFFISIRALAVQRKLDTMKSEFINNMTHEIKTPLATVSLACEMLRDDTISNDEESRKNFLGIINDENHRLRVLVDTILQSAKMSNKKFRINPKEVDVHSLIEKVSKSFNLTLANRDGFLVKRLEASPSVIVADETHLTNLIFNLIDNGIKYSTESPHITIATKVVDGRFLLSVSDEGIGISKEDQRHVFEKFYRVSTGDIHNVKGFGIGLNYVAQVVKLHQGHITLESELGKGSTFTVSLPVD